MHPSSRARLRTFGLMMVAYAAAATAQSDSGGGAPPAQDFATAKAQHVARLQQELACVEASTTLETLHACRPQPPGGRRGPPPNLR